MACRPASRMTMTKPRSFQALDRITEGSAHRGSVHQPGCGRPTAPRTALTKPLEGLSSHFHTRATTIQLVITGRKYTALKMERPAILRLRANANARPPT